MDYSVRITNTILPLHVQKQRGLLNLEPEYQRGFVWDKASSSRLVETILLGLPVPEVSFLQLLMWMLSQSETFDNTHIYRIPLMASVTVTPM